MKRGIVPLALTLALLLAGCGGHSNVQGRSTFGTLLAIGLIIGVSYDGDRGVPRLARVPELDPLRRVLEQDCTRPIEDRSANLKCR